MPEQGMFTPEDSNREAQLEADRATAAAPLPYADRQHYRHEGERQADLSAAEDSNVARAAQELKVTTVEWLDKRKELGRTPRRGDF